jgi:hypothetical protein
MKRIPILALLLAVCCSLAFTPSSVNDTEPSIAGKYGVCGSEADEAHVISVELILNSDNTFSYIDNTDRDNKLHVSGKWSLYEGDVFLTDYPPGVRIHKIWKTEKNSTVLKSRKGTAYYRLCRIGEVANR